MVIATARRKRQLNAKIQLWNNGSNLRCCSGHGCHMDGEAKRQQNSASTKWKCIMLEGLNTHKNEFSNNTGLQPPHGLDLATFFGISSYNGNSDRGTNIYDWNAILDSETCEYTKSQSQCKFRTRYAIITSRSKVMPCRPNRGQDWAKATWQSQPSLSPPSQRPCYSIEGLGLRKGNASNGSSTSFAT